jgi:hypothetical protein
MWASRRAERTLAISTNPEHREGRRERRHGVDDVVRRGWVAGLAAIGLLLSMWLPWFGDQGRAEGSGSGDLAEQLEAAGVSLTANAWEAFSLIDVVLFITALAGLGLAAVAVLGIRDERAVVARRLTLGLGLLSVVLILYRVGSPAAGQAMEEVGLFLGLAAAAGVAYSGLDLYL